MRFVQLHTLPIVIKIVNKLITRRYLTLQEFHNKLRRTQTFLYTTEV